MPGSFFYGTNNFEYVWEKLIDIIFGETDKTTYFPRTKWELYDGSEKNNFQLEPDSIMKYKNNIFVLDAKFYRFGVIANPRDLPNTSSISKQITYGERVDEIINSTSSNNNRKRTVYNAFLMPYNKYKTLFAGDSNYLNIGEATGDWKLNNKNYERVQGILIDVRYLINQYRRKNKNEIACLARVIKNSY